MDAFFKKILNNRKLLISLVLFIFLVIVILLSDHSKIIMRYMGLYLLIIMGSISLSYLFKKEIEKTIPIYFILLFVFLYFFGIIDLLLIGLWSFIGITIISFICCIIWNIKNKTVYDTLKNIIKPGLIVFTILYFSFALFTRNIAFYVWDEFTFWSIATKNMFFSNKLYTMPGTTVVGFYPPCPTIIEYFFCKLIGVYSQGIEIFALQMFGFSLFMPFYKNLSFKDNKKTIISIFISILLIPAIFCDSNFYNTIYADVILGILAGYYLFELFTSNNDKFMLFEMCVTLFIITLTKSTGIIISLLLFILSIVYLGIVYNKSVSSFIKGNFIKILCMISSIIAAFISWKIHLMIFVKNVNNGYMNLEAANNNTVLDMFKTVIGTVVGSTEKLNVSFETLFRDLFDKTLTSMPFEITGTAWIVIFVLLYYFIYKYLIKNDKKKFKYYALLIGFISVLYVILIQVAYYLVFYEIEAIHHLSLNRYIGTLFVAILMFAIGFLYNEFHKKNKSINMLIPCLLLIFTPVSAVTDATICSGVYSQIKQQGIKNQVWFSNYIKERVESNARIYPIHQTQNIDSFLIQFRYYMTPTFIPMVDTFSDERVYSYIRFKNSKQFEKELYDKYDYLVILHKDDYFEKNYSSLFENEDVEHWSLYKIIKNDDKKVKLKRVE